MSIESEFKLIDSALARATEHALAMIEWQARAVLEASPDTVKSFCMAMGSASFNVVWSEDWEEEELVEFDENLDPWEMAERGHGNAHTEALAKILNDYDRALCLTGSPMRITRDHVTGELITANDW